MYSNLQTVLLAGGFGTRVAHLLPEIPKPMATVAGRPFVEWVIRYFAYFGLRRFVLSTGYRAEVIERHFASPGAGLDLACRRETKPLGTAGGFLNAIRDQAATSDGWLVANADSLVVTNPAVLAQKGRASNWAAALLAINVPDAARYGSIALKPDGTLEAFAEKRPGKGLINGGVYWIAPETIEGFPRREPLSFENDVFPGLIADGARVGVVAVDAPFIDIGTPATLAIADAFIRENLAPTLGK